MSLPTYEEFMLPFLRAVADGEPHRTRDLIDQLSEVLQLTEEQRLETLKSGSRVVGNRVGWARTYLKKAKLIESPQRGVMLITARGRQVLDEGCEGIDKKFLDQFDDFREWNRGQSTDKPESDLLLDSTLTPDEVMEAAFKQHTDQVAAELLETLKSCSPYFFEKVVLNLLQAMGYGGLSGHGLVTPKSGDGGIDGVIYEDKLGLDNVCIQAKRWEATVGRKTIQEFAGSMDLYRSRKGVILTTSGYSKEAREFVDRIEGKKVVLVDGTLLTQLMIDYKVGVTTSRTYELALLSQDFFDEDV